MSVWLIEWKPPAKDWAVKHDEETWESKELADGRVEFLMKYFDVTKLRAVEYVRKEGV